MITRIGGTKPILLNLRVIAATNIPLQNLVSQGLFREDLYYRLYVMVINLPLLNQRKEDLEELTRHFVAEFGSAKGTEAPLLSPMAFQKLYDYSWPGNVRELKNVLHRAVLFCEGREIAEELIRFDEELEPTKAQPLIPPATPLFSQVLANMTDNELKIILKKFKCRVGYAARELKVTPRALYYRIKNRKIDLNVLRAELKLALA